MSAIRSATDRPATGSNRSRSPRADPLKVRGAHAVLVAAALVLGGCLAEATPTPIAPCSEELPERTTSSDFPIGVLYVGGNDLPAVVEAVDWNGGAEPVATTAPRAINLERFTVLHADGLPEVSIRLTDGAEIGSWTVQALPNDRFRIGDFETGRESWSEGDVPSDLVCVPIRDGQWAIVAEIAFAGDAGTATYWWRINVENTPDG